MSRSIFGWDLPPGCSISDIDRAYGIEEPEPVRCPHCSAFLPREPLETAHIEATEWHDSLGGDLHKIVVQQLIGIWICRRCGKQTEWSVE